MNVFFPPIFVKQQLLSFRPQPTCVITCGIRLRIPDPMTLFRPSAETQLNFLTQQPCSRPGTHPPQRPNY
jgi:hypothetical protein